MVGPGAGRAGLVRRAELRTAETRRTAGEAQRTALMVIYQPNDSILETGDVEIDEQADAMVA